MMEKGGVALQALKSSYKRAPGTPVELQNGAHARAVGTCLNLMELITGEEVLSFVPPPNPYRDSFCVTLSGSDFTGEQWI